MKVGIRDSRGEAGRHEDEINSGDFEKDFLEREKIEFLGDQIEVLDLRPEK